MIAGQDLLRHPSFDLLPILKVDLDLGLAPAT